MWVKICGTTNLEDALLAAEAGADAVGFVLAERSRRRVTAEAVGEIARAMEQRGVAVERWGVFELLDAGEIVERARTAGLTGVQLHGGGGAALAGAVQAMAPELGVMAVVSWEMGMEDAAQRAVAAMEELRREGVERVLLDSTVGAARGGTGVAFAWEEAARALTEARGEMRLVVAGGLTPETVAKAVEVLRPWGVDVASGVELEAGRKSPAAVERFVAAARGVTPGRRG